MPNDEWFRTLADGRKVKFSHDELMETTFITAQIQGNEVVYSILLNKAEVKLSREEVEGRFQRELSKKWLRRLTVMARPLRVLSDSRVLSRGLGDARLRHFFPDTGECRYVRFVPGFPYGSHVYP